MKKTQYFVEYDFTAPDSKRGATLSVDRYDYCPHCKQMVGGGSASLFISKAKLDKIGITADDLGNTFTIDQLRGVLRTAAQTLSTGVPA